MNLFSQKHGFITGAELSRGSFRVHHPAMVREPPLPLPHQIQMEAGGRIHKGEYVVSKGIVTVTCGRRRAATPVGAMAPDRVAWMLFRSLIARAKSEP
jgi:hypothetical protein